MDGDKRLPWNEGCEWTLTLQELSCLSALAHGRLTDILGNNDSLESSEIDAALDRAVAKLGCRDRFHAVIKATSLGLVRDGELKKTDKH